MHVCMSREAKTYLGNGGGRTVAAEFGSECIAFKVHWKIQLKRYGEEKWGLCTSSA